MYLKLDKSEIKPVSELTITGSKSESNRLLLLQAQFPEIEISNLSNSDDSKVMQKALANYHEVIDIHHAGTAMRFLTAFFAAKENHEVMLTGSDRMKQRPIAILVDALRELGAQIDYLEDVGCPPLKIKGQNLLKNKVSLNANVSSQYISALLLIAPKLQNGLELTLQGKITSIPYIKMTLALLNEIGVKTSFESNVIKVFPLTSEISNSSITVESDWSSASYFYSIVAMSPVDTEIVLSSYREDSLQGDAVLSEIYRGFGVETSYFGGKIKLKKIEEVTTDGIELNLNKAPDIAQTIAVTCLGLGLGCELKGLHTLKIKETDRLEALKIEIEKLGGKIKVSENQLNLEPKADLKSNVDISTYNDHRMAMAFAPLSLKTKLNIKDADVVTKSYPRFWDDLKLIRFKISQ
ncbi:MAG: 3-phosphoshikimate 1-carboxyvinyltransferase [Bacteroidota bacterium]